MAWIDDHSRQNPAYRPAHLNVRTAGLSACGFVVFMRPLYKNSFWVIINLKAMKEKGFPRLFTVLITRELMPQAGSIKMGNERQVLSGAAA